MMEAEPEDSNLKNPEFSSWLVITRAHLSLLNCLGKVLSVIESDSGDADMEFEDCASDSDQEGPVVDLDQVRQAALQLANVPLVRSLAQAFPQLVGLSQATDNILDELQEKAFGVLTTLYFCEDANVRTGMMAHAIAIVQEIEEYIKLTGEHKACRPSAEACCELLAKVVEINQDS